MSRARSLGGVAAATLLTLVALELVLRVVAATGHSRFASMLRAWDPAADSLVPLGESCYRQRPLARFRFVNGQETRANRLGFRGPEVALRKPDGAYRVVLLGGSTSHGTLVGDDETIDAHLRRALAAAGVARPEVVNLGFDSLDALCDRERLRAEGLPLAPDAVILHTGINDVPALRFPQLAPNDPARGARAAVRNGEDARRATRGLWRAVKRWLLLARLPGVLRVVAAPSGPLPGPPEPEPRALDAFEATVRGAIDLVPPGVTVLLSTPPSGLATSAAGAPTAKPLVVDAATTQRYRDALDARLRGIAADLAARGRDVRYVPHAVPDDAFLDDCHLTSDGNRAVADDFARSLTTGRRRGATP